MAFKPHYNICVGCGKPTLVVVKTMLCSRCNYEKKKSKKKITKSKKVAYKATGEYEVFKRIGASREHKCFICEKPLHVLTVSNFMHVLPKKQYEKFRLEEKNIVIGCHDFQSSCHDVWDKQPRSKIADDPKWQKMFKLEEELKNQYKSVTN